MTRSKSHAVALLLSPQVDYKISASGSLTKPFGESDEDSAGREVAGAGAGNPNATAAAPTDLSVIGAAATAPKKDSDKEGGTTDQT